MMNCDSHGTVSQNKLLFPDICLQQQEKYPALKIGPRDGVDALVMDLLW